MHDHKIYKYSFIYSDKGEELDKKKKKLNYT